MRYVQRSGLRSEGFGFAHADVICREITVEEINHIVKGFGTSAAIAKGAGFGVSS